MNFDVIEMNAFSARLACQRASRSDVGRFPCAIHLGAARARFTAASGLFTHYSGQTFGELSLFFGWHYTPELRV